MSDKDALLRAILTAPDEDTPRLIYADWLEEHEGKDGAERAWMIRTDIAAHAAGGRGCLWVDSESMEKRQLRPWMVREITSLPFHRLCDYGLAYTRGFISEIHLPTSKFLDHSAAIFASHPVVTVQLDDRVPLNNAGVASYFGEEPGPADWWGWLRAVPNEHPHRLASWQLPFVLWKDEIEDGFTSEQAAYSWLSQRCVSFGRTAAGLPPM